MQTDAQAQDPGWGDAWNYTCSHPCLWTAPWVRDVWLVRGPSQRGGALFVFEHVFEITMGMEAGFPTAPLRSPDDYNIYNIYIGFTTFTFFPLLIPEAYCCHIPRRHWFHKELCLTGEACGSRVPLHLKLRKSYVFMGSWIEFGADPSIDLSPYLKVVPLDNVRLQLLPNGWLPFR